MPNGAEIFGFLVTYVFVLTGQTAAFYYREILIIVLTGCNRCCD